MEDGVHGQSGGFAAGAVAQVWGTGIYPYITQSINNIDADIDTGSDTSDETDTDTDTGTENDNKTDTDTGSDTDAETNTDTNSGSDTDVEMILILTRWLIK